MKEHKLMKVFDDVSRCSPADHEELQKKPQLSEDLYLLREITHDEMDELLQWHLESEEQCHYRFAGGLTILMEGWEEGDHIGAASSCFRPLAGWAGFVLYRDGKLKKDARMCTVWIS